MAYFEAKKEDEKKRQEKIDRKGKNALMWLGGVMVTIICFFLVTRYVEYTEEKRQQKEEYERNHPEMKVTRVENRQAVDLGLSVKWATCDIGANLPTEAGNKYGWGDTTGIIYTGYHYNGEEYIPEDNINEYAYPSRIEKEVPTTIVGSKYDVAKQCWGEKWRMPTRAEAQELIDSCEFVRQDDYIAAIGPSGKSVLFPLFDQWHNEYATGELDTLPIFGVHPNKSIYTFIIAKEYYDGFPTGKLYVKMANSGRASMLRLRAVCEK
jgi:hypothetical protein